MKRGWLFWLLVIVLLWVAASRLTALTDLAAVGTRGQWQWLLAAALLQALCYLLHTVAYQSALGTVGIASRIRELVPVVLASVFVSTTTYAGRTGGARLLADQETTRDRSAETASTGTQLARVADLGAFATVAAAGTIYLLVTARLTAYQTVAALALLAAAAGLGSVLWLGLAAPRRFQALLGSVQRAIDRLATGLNRSPWLPSKWAEASARKLAGAAPHRGRQARTLAAALAAHLASLASLYLLFVAFHEPVHLGVLVSGYAAGIFSRILSITPQGIGLVEGTMALAYAFLGVPPAESLVIALAFRGLAFWLPLLAGFALLGRVKTLAGATHARTGAFGVRAVTIVTAVAGMVNVLSAMLPALGERMAVLQETLPLVLRRGARIITVLAGFGLLLLARNLWRRKRVAWLLALVLLATSIAGHLIKGLDYEEAALEGALLICLLLLHRRFPARSDLPSIRHSVGVLIAALVFVAGYATTGFYLLDRHFGVDYDLGAALAQSVAMFGPFADPGLEPITAFGRYFSDSIYVVAAATVGYAVLMLFRPVLMRDPPAENERARATSIVQAYGRSSIARFALFNDKSYYWSPDGSLIAHVVKGRVAVALGDPIGPVEDAATAISGFRAHCARNDWQSVFYQTLPDYLDHYRAAGLQVLCIGHEAIVDLDAFTLSGRANKALRTRVNRFTGKGYRPVVHEPPLSEDLIAALRSVSDEWLADVRGAEKQFSLGRFEDAYLRSGPVMVLYEPGGTISAFANILSEYQLNETTIDLMRYRRGAESGTMDFLFVSLFEWAKNQGYETFNLGLSGLARVGERASDPLVERVLAYIYEHLNQFYNFKGLYEYKAKYHPHWSPRYLVYPSQASLPAAVTALVRADSGDDFAREYLKDLIEMRRERRAQSKRATGNE